MDDAKASVRRRRRVCRHLDDAVQVAGTGEPALVSSYPNDEEPGRNRECFIRK